MKQMEPISNKSFFTLTTKLVALVFLLLLSANPVSAAELKNSVETSSPPVKQFLSDFRELTLSPLHWEKKQWLTASLVLGTTVMLYNNDAKLFALVQEQRNEAWDLVSTVVQPLGNGLYLLPSLAGLYLYGCSAGEEKITESAGLCLESYLVSSSFVYILKMTAHRHRPNTGDPYYTWDGPGLSLKNLSFPSGHSAGVFSIASVLATIYQENKYIPVLVYGLAGATALSRVYDQAHWPSDVFFGSMLGYLTGKAVMALHEEKKEFIVAPTLLTPNQYGILLLCCF